MKKINADGKRNTMSAQEELGANVREIMGIPSSDVIEEADPQEASLRDDPPPKKKKRRGRAYVAISYFFVLIFLMLIGYIVYFNLKLRDDVMRSPYNKRQDAAAKYVTRGPIESRDGITLAYTETDSEGRDYRVYPEGRRFAHIIGYDTNGKTGAESIANYELLTSGDSIVQQFINDLRGCKNAGQKVVVTVDYDLQRAAYSALGDHRGAVCALDPDTGAIYAMVSKPDFDPNDIRTDWNEIISEEGSSVLVNRATQGRYPPGSTFKIITTLAYIRTRGSTAGFTYDCTGEVEVDGHTIHCAKGNVHGEQTLEEAFANSCNCAFATLGKQLGTSRLRSAAQDLYFNKAIPSAGLVYNNSSFSLESSAEDFLIMQTAFGQGKTLVTPWHMTLITAAIARNGVMPEPYLIDHIENAAGDRVSAASPKNGKRIISSKEATELKSLLRAVVEQGTAGSLGDREYTAYGKTGSAEYTKSDGETGTHSWFTGFAELNGKRLVVTVLAEDGGSGSSTALPAAREIFDTYFAD